MEILLHIVMAACLIAALLNSKIYLGLLSYISLDKFYMMTCALCFGFWQGIIIGLSLGYKWESILFAAATAVGAELIDRVLKTWRI